jgi:RNA polymerase sigma-70 factor (ECF subfamily)
MTRALVADGPAALCAGEGGIDVKMTEAEFREIYELTARPLKSYLVRLTGNTVLAEDFVQESFYRLLRSAIPSSLDLQQKKSYLYRIATNLARDHLRSKRFEPSPLEERSAAVREPAPDSALAADLGRALAGISPRERELVLLAYVEGASHREIAAVTGVKEASVRPLLFRVKQKLAALLRERGYQQGKVE